jgi:transcriptional regulator with XRE-family HTH domain
MTISEWSDNFSENLLSLLEDRRMSQRELAQESDVSVGSISAYINKHSLPSIKAILNIACALDVDVTELIDFGDTID